jgi:hypothetical protein
LREKTKQKQKQENSGAGLTIQFDSKKKLISRSIQPDRKKKTINLWSATFDLFPFYNNIKRRYFRENSTHAKLR